jgi:hypothetical protein
LTLSALKGRLLIGLLIHPLHSCHKHKSDYITHLNPSLECYVE